MRSHQQFRRDNRRGLQPALQRNLSGVRAVIGPDSHIDSIACRHCSLPVLHRFYPEAASALEAGETVANIDRTTIVFVDFSNLLSRLETEAETRSE